MRSYKQTIPTHVGIVCASNLIKPENLKIAY